MTTSNAFDLSAKDEPSYAVATELHDLCADEYIALTASAWDAAPLNVQSQPFGVRANAICPGAVEGQRMEGVLAREAAVKGMTRDQVYDGYAAGTSMRSFVEARDIAEMAVFLGSDRARLVSGQVIAVDGHTENPDPKV